jgi:hypothetical protein
VSLARLGGRLFGALASKKVADKLLLLMKWKEVNSMTTVEAIEQEIKKLSPKELAELRQWFASFDADAWDTQIENDAQAGKLDALAAEALAEYEAGKAREI